MFTVLVTSQSRPSPTREKTVCCVLFLLLSLNALAQSQVTRQSLQWTRYYLSLRIDDNQRIRQEVEWRSYWFPWRRHQALTRTHWEYRWNEKVRAAAGFSYFVHHRPHDPRAENFQAVQELRPKVELAFRQMLKPALHLSHRYWLEGRFFEQPTSDIAFEHIRFRYRALLQYEMEERWTASLFGEIHLQAPLLGNVQIFDQTRAGLSLRYQFTRHWGTELSYIHWFQQRAALERFYERHIIRLTLHHTLQFQHSDAASQ